MDFSFLFLFIHPLYLLTFLGLNFIGCVFNVLMACWLYLQHEQQSSYFVQQLLRSNRALLESVYSGGNNNNDDAYATEQLINAFLTQFQSEQPESSRADSSPSDNHPTNKNE